MIHEKENIEFSTGEVRRVNANFVQLYDDHLDLIMLMTKENSTALTIFLWIVKHMDNRNAVSYTHRDVYKRQSYSRGLKTAK